MGESVIKGNFYGITAEDENRKLKEVKEAAKSKIEQVKRTAAGLQEDLKSLREVYDVDDKEGLAQWFNTDARFNEVRNDLRRAERALSKPFFGRIDIEDDAASKRETFYIGKSVIATDPANPMVIDWRAPISSVYYDHSLGICDYKVPKEGKFRVDLKRKRTYEIENEEIKDFYDSDVVANDDLLTKYLSKSKRNVLSEIIATIQKEQNEVIRKNPRHNVLVQGSAGSGKTTVAMHRISYILYNYDVEFKPESFYIVGSNKVLLNYITGVLPDLDVYGVRQMTMEELFTRLLYEDWDDKKYSIRKFEKSEKGIEIKGGTKWYKDLRKFCDEVEFNHIPKDDIVIERTNRTLLTGEEIKEAIKEYPEWPMFRKFERLNDLLMVKLENELYGRYYSYNVEEQKKLTRYYTNYFNKFIWKTSVFSLYKEFVDKKMAERCVFNYEEDKPDLYDLASLAYIYKRIKETEVIQEASHVVIDEAQDFGMMVYRSLKYCMSKCTFTIMGDVSQNINFSCGLSDWEELKKVMLPNKYDYFGLLRKSYRNTVEISNFATDVLRHASFPIYPVEPIVRHGDEVNVEGALDTDSLNKLVEKKALEFKEKEYETIAIICKDLKESEEVYKAIGKKIGARLFNDKEAEFSNGTIILPIEYSKGLEFDAVIIYDASMKAYPKEDGYAKLLYVAATRALHELSVFYKGELTGLIKDPIPEDRKTINFLEDDFHVKPFVYEEEFKTKEEIAKEQAKEGDRERALRDKYGPARIIVNSKGQVEKTVAKKKATVVSKTPNLDTPINRRVEIVKPKTFKPELAYSLPKEKKEPIGATEFGRMPDGTSLQPIGHGRIDNSVKWIKADKSGVEITGSYGILKITPVSDETVRVLFYKGTLGKVSALPEEIKKKEGLKWRVSESREGVDIILDKLIVKVVKKTGEVSFYNKSNNLLLTENQMLPRQFHGTKDVWWEYFDFTKKETLSIRGESDSDWVEVSNSAKYMSHNPKNRPALLMSNKGYQIMIPEGVHALLCTIPAYGPYISFEETPYIDYIFRSAR
ncbi:MAG: ATP-binding domain-containing protein [Lachnospiraceae bacterium]|nr:ATP-binding domain-containing protein [Lachnospiraceae bacterium]